MYRTDTTGSGINSLAGQMGEEYQGSELVGSGRDRERRYGEKGSCLGGKSTQVAQG